MVIGNWEIGIEVCNLEDEYLIVGPDGSGAEVDFTVMINLQLLP